MTMPGTRRPPAPQLPAGGLGAGMGDTLFIGAVLAFAAVVGVVWAGAALAAAMSGGTFRAGLADAAHALMRMPSRSGREPNRRQAP